jgi:hypothetical protein
MCPLDRHGSTQEQTFCGARKVAASTLARHLAEILHRYVWFLAMVLQVSGHLRLILSKSAFNQYLFWGMRD